MSTVTIRLNQEEIFFKSYAQLTGQSLPSISKKVLECHFPLECGLKVNYGLVEHFRRKVLLGKVKKFGKAKLNFFAKKMPET
ncbi:hypothetical protein [Streptococcus porci]|uniref:hypothetical protein n=1 Tax=Streptococcus porci TaxID=502567 RepID=UPI000410C3B8